MRMYVIVYTWRECTLGVQYKNATQKILNPYRLFLKAVYKVAINSKI